MTSFLKDNAAFVTVVAIVTLAGTSLAQGTRTLTHMETVLSRSDPRVIILEKLADKAFMEGRFRDSIRLYSRAMGKAPDRTSLYLGRAMANEMLRRTRKAVKDYEKALELDRDSYRAMEGLAGIFERGGKKDRKAIALYQKALARDPRPEWKENIAVWINMLQSRLRPTEQSPIALWRQGNIRSHEGKNSEAELLYTKALALNPLFYQAYFRRGLIRLERGDLQGALQDLDATVGLAPELRGALVQRGLVHEQLGNEQRALDDFMRAVRADSRDPYAHFWLGRLLEKKRLFVKALDSYQQALKLKPKPELRGLLHERMSIISEPVRLALRQRSRIRRILRELW